MRHSALMAGILTLWCWTVPAVGQSRQLTPAEARQKVTALAQVDDDAIVKDTVVSLGGRTLYRFELQNGDRYSIDTETHRVSVIYTSRISAHTSQQVEADQLPMATLERVARDTVTERFPEGAAMTLALWSPPHFDGYSYNFSFGQVLPGNGARTDNGCTVSVGADTGKVISYSDHLETIPFAARRLPRVNAGQAGVIAARATRSADVLKAEPRLVFTEGRLQWTIKFRGIDSNGRVGTFNVEVDADNGQVLDVTPYASLGSPQPPSQHIMLARKVLRKGLGPIKSAAGSLVSEKLVEALGGRVERAGEVVTIRGEKSVEVPREHFRVEAGKLFLLATAIAQAFPATVHVLDVDPRRNAVNFICDPASATEWFTEQGRTFVAAEGAPDRYADVVAAVERLELAATNADPVGRETAPAPDSNHSRVLIGVITGAFALSLACLAFRRRQPGSPRQGSDSGV